MPSENKKRKNSSRSWLLKRSRSDIKTNHEHGSNDIASILLNGQSCNDTKRPGNNVEVNIFPSAIPWVVVLVTFVIRVYYVIDPTSWWVLHPDEVFQSMDVAHSEVYGYGFRPYEYIGPAKGSNLSHYQVRETMLGMNALRSPIYPQLLALVASVSSKVGFNFQPFLLWRITHVTVTSFLPLAVSLFVKSSGHSSDVAVLASILIGASTHLTIFGTHTIINSFISPFIFLALSRLVNIIIALQKNANKEIDLIISTKTNTTVYNYYLFQQVYHWWCRNLTSLKDRFAFSCDRNDKNYCYSNSTQESEYYKTIPDTNDNTSERIATFDVNGSSSQSMYSDCCQIPDLINTCSNRSRDLRHSSSSDSGFDNWSHSSSSSSSSSRSGSSSSSSSTDNGLNDSLSDNEDTHNSNNKNINHRNSIISNDNNNKNIHNRNNNISNDSNNKNIHNRNNNISNDSNNKNIHNRNNNISNDNNNKNIHNRNNDISNDIVNSYIKSVFDGCKGKHVSDSYNYRQSSIAITCVKVTIFKIFHFLTSSTILDFVTGFILGMSMYIRLDSSLFIAVVIMANANPFYIFSFMCRSKFLWIIAIGACVGVLLCILDDLYFYQDIVISPWQWFNFNVLSSLSSQFYGSSGATFYIATPFFANAGMSIFSILFATLVFHSLLEYLSLYTDVDERKKLNKTSHPERNVFDIAGQIFRCGKSDCFEYSSIFPSINASYSCSILILVSIYSFFGHKEERFMHDILVLFLITSASYLIFIVHRYASSIYKKRQFICFIAISFCLNQWHAMPDHSNKSGVNQCLHFISQQDDVRGLFLESQFPYSFSYSILHRKVPFVTILNKDFIEFTEASLISTNRNCFINSNNCTASYMALNSVSNLIQLTNSQDIIKHLMKRPYTYNYAIISSSKEFFRPAYAPVFETSTYNVWRFTDNIKERKDLEKTVNELKIDEFQLQAMQEYEAEVLKQLGKYWSAIERFESALKYAKSTRPRLLASMVYCLQRLGRKQHARRVFKGCLKLSDVTECSKGDRSRVPQLGFSHTLK